MDTSFFVNIFFLLRDIIISPISHPDLLWILIPTWVSWFFAEFFQEKHGTSFGNAISNGIVSLFIGLDWLRQLSKGTAENSLQMIISYIVLTYGFLIILLGVRANPIAHYIGRIREVTFILVVLTPAMYGYFKLDTGYAIAAVIGFGLFYLIVELIDRITPDPRAVKADDSKW